MSKIQELKEQANQILKENGYSRRGLPLKYEHRIDKEYRKYLKQHEWIPGHSIR